MQGTPNNYNLRARKSLDYQRMDQGTLYSESSENEGRSETILPNERENFQPALNVDLQSRRAIPKATQVRNRTSIIDALRNIRKNNDLPPQNCLQIWGQLLIWGEFSPGGNFPPGGNFTPGGNC
ncbi:hypothetical protein JTB14_036277 [Gonioctena quinquepunctata]|nr:hypothetical protein JTB14_036277 [Gonioctena quinquepunctata]